MTREELEGIEEELGHVRECYKEVIRRWVKETEPKPTWQVLVTALREVREERVARYIKSTYTVGGSHTHNNNNNNETKARNTLTVLCTHSSRSRSGCGAAGGSY